jgi:hypothetical protein
MIYVVSVYWPLELLILYKILMRMLTVMCIYGNGKKVVIEPTGLSKCEEFPECTWNLCTRHFFGDSSGGDGICLVWPDNKLSCCCDPYLHQHNV